CKWYADDLNLIESMPIRLQVIHIIYVGSLIAGKEQKIISEADFTNHMKYFYSTQKKVFGFRPKKAKRGFVIARQKVAEIRAELADFYTVSHKVTKMSEQKSINSHSTPTRNHPGRSWDPEKNIPFKT
ncbi:unnamed protein product, partial [marine sediment metagenome]